jgi:subtilisin family serine protease
MLDPALEEQIESISGPDEAVEVILRLQDSYAPPPPGTRIVSRFGDVVTCRVRSDQIRDIRRHKSVVSMKAARFLNWEPPSAVEDYKINKLQASRGEEAYNVTLETDNFRIPRKFTGKNVVVACLDWGIDFASKAFRKEDGKTRFLAIWDQSVPMSPNKPNHYGYGIIYLRNEIDNALQRSNPYVALGYHPAKDDPFSIGSHGTHVLDIAAGTRRISPLGEIQGIAPDSDLMFVNLGAQHTEGIANLGDSYRLLQGLDFVAKTAGEQPWVINLSLGSHGGPHDGSTPVERAMDNLILEAPGRAICMSTGNYQQSQAHAHGRLRPGSSRTLTWMVDPADVTPNELEVWYNGRDTFTVSVAPPTSDQIFSVALDEKIPIVINGQEVGRIYHRKDDPNNHDNHIDIFLYNNASTGQWKVTLTANDIIDGKYHIWIERDRGDPRNQSRLSKGDALSTYTIGSICNGERTIAVGAFDSRNPNAPVASFSSCGLTRDGRQKPDIVAPGVQIFAARSTPFDAYEPHSNLVAKSGASMAAPHVAGTLALIFQAAAPRKLGITELQKVILSSTQKASKNLSCFGDGYLDINRAIQAAEEYIKEQDKSSTNYLISPQRQISSHMSEANGVSTLVLTSPPSSTVTSDNTVMANRLNDVTGTQEGNSASGSQNDLSADILEDFEVENQQNSEGSETEDQHQGGEEEERAGLRARRRNFILISGGPGPYDNRDTEHDQSWANYVTPPLLLTDSTKKLEKFSDYDEDVWWFVYKPAYVRRWNQDSSNPNRKRAVDEIKSQGFSSYVDLIEGRAKSRNWNLRWFNDGDELWHKLGTFRDPISRVWYWGHARGDLWLSIRHQSDGTPYAPEQHEIIRVSQIKDNEKNLSHLFKSSNKSRRHRLIGCNTEEFAKEWAKTFKVWSEGIEGVINFKEIHKTGGEPTLSPGAEIKLFSPGGVETEHIESLSSSPDSSLIGDFEDDDDQYRTNLTDIDDIAASDDGLYSSPEYHNESPSEQLKEPIMLANQEAIGQTTIGSGYVDLADNIISSGRAWDLPKAFLEDVFSRSTSAAPEKNQSVPFGLRNSASLDLSQLFSPEVIFDIIVFGKNPLLKRQLETIFDVVAAPGSFFTGFFLPGDLLLRRFFGTNFAHLSIITNPEILKPDQTYNKRVVLESSQPGSYIQVVDGGAQPHYAAQCFARRILDEFGRVPYNQLIVRGKQVTEQLEENQNPSRRRSALRCCYKLSEKERASIANEVDRVFAERTGITRKLKRDSPEDRPRIEEWLRIWREIVRSTVMKRKPGIVTTIDPVLINAFLSQYEGDSRVPIKATEYYLTSPKLLAMGLALRDKVIVNWSSGRSPITLEQFYDLAFDITNHCGTAILLCHNVAKAFARGGTAIYWQYNEATGSYEDGKNSYVPKLIHRKGVIIPRPKGKGKSIFYLLFLADELGTDDPGDWYHYFVNATVASYSTADEVGSASSAANDYAERLNGMVAWTSDKMKDSTIGPTSSYKGWLWANALSFLEGAYYGESQEAVKRESHLHLAGAVFGILQAGGSIDKSWRWHVPKASSISKWDYAIWGIDFKQTIHQILDINGNVISQAAEPGKPSGPRER